MTLAITKVVTIFLVLSVLVGGIYADHLPHHDFYPFFSWNLFSNVSVSDTSYFVKVKAGKDDMGQLVYSDKVSEYLNIEFLPDYFWTIQQIGQNISKNIRYDDLGYIENNFKVKPFEYEIVKVIYDPLLLKQKGIYFSSETIATFRLGRDY